MCLKSSKVWRTVSLLTLSARRLVFAPLCKIVSSLTWTFIAWVAHVRTLIYFGSLAEWILLWEGPNIQTNFGTFQNFSKTFQKISFQTPTECMFFSSMSYTSTQGLTDAAAISTKLEKTCSAINDQKAKSMCNQFIARDGLVDLLQQRRSPSDICKALGDCHPRVFDDREKFIAERARQYVLEHPFTVVAQSSTECQLCQWIFSAYESWLSDGQTEAEIALFLSQLCNFFGNYAPQCNQLVRVYVPKVIQSYVERTTPPILCSSIGFCQLPINTLTARP